MINRELFSLFLLMGSIQSTYAAVVTVSYTATIGFDPSATVGVGGQNAETLINELFGPGIGSTGKANLTGSFTYETNTLALNSNTQGAGYVNAITAASATLNGSSVNADISEIALNAETSDIGYNTNPSNGFCGSREGCLAIGEPFTSTGNLVQVINDSNFFILRDGNRTDFFNRDAVSLSLGATDSDNEFSPKLVTPSFGDVFVDELGLLFVSDANRSLINSVEIPTTDTFVTSSEIETTILSLTFSGKNIPDGFTLEGELNDFTTVVPVPAAIWFMGTGLLGLIGKTRCKNKFTG